MARTLNLLRKRRSNQDSSTSSRKIFSELRKRKSELQRWMEPLYKKKNQTVVIVDSSDDEATSVSAAAAAAAVLKNREFLLGGSKATAIEIDENMEIETAPEIQVSSGDFFSKQPGEKKERQFYTSGDKWFSGETGQLQCKATTRRGNPCNYCAVEIYNYEYCNRHSKFAENISEEKHTSSYEPASEFSEDDDSFVEVTPSSVQVVNDGHSKRALMMAGANDNQCYALTKHGALCRTETKANSIYCHWHRKDRLFGSLLEPDGGEIAFGDERKSVSGSPQLSLTVVKCAALTSRNTPCKYDAINSTPYCRIHNRFSEKNDSEVETSDSEEYIPGRFASNEFDFDSSISGNVFGHEIETQKPKKTEKDTVYRARKGQERCIAINSTEKQCSYQAVNRTVYCHSHGKNHLNELSPESKSSLCQLQRSSASGNDMDNDSSISDSGESDADDDNEPRPYKHKEFLRMWRECEEYCGVKTDEIENTRRVRGANQSMSPDDTDGQLKAQYGRLLPRAMKVRYQHNEIDDCIKTPFDIFSLSFRFSF